MEYLYSYLSQRRKKECKEKNTCGLKTFAANRSPRGKLKGPEKRKGKGKLSYNSQEGEG